MIANMNGFITEMKHRVAQFPKGKVLLSLALPAVLGCAFAVFAASKGGFDLYMTIILPFIAIGCIFLLFTQLYDGPIVPAFCIVLLMFIGVSLQILLAMDGDTALADAASLVLCYALGILLGLAGIAMLSTALNYLKPKQLCMIFLACTVALYLVVMLFGKTINGTRAWLHLGSMSLQVTEITKPIGIIHFACIFTDASKSEGQRMRNAIGIMLLHAVCLFSMNELGTLVILAIAFFTLAITYVSSGKMLLILLLIGVAVALIVYGFCSTCNRLVMNGNDSLLVETAASIYRKINLRIDLLVHPETMDPYGPGYQVTRASEALSISRWFGSSYDHPVPVAHSDFVFVYICLRMGIAAGIGVLIITVLFLTSASTCLGNHNLTEGGIGMSCIVAISAQSLVSAASSINLIPTIGISIPLIGRGGSAVVVSLAMLMLAFWAMRSSIQVPKKRFKEDILYGAEKNLCTH